ncbi:hypothetical protein [Azospirillum argentinense]
MPDDPPSPPPSLSIPATMAEALSAFHAGGRDEAGRICEFLLARDGAPDPDALHLPSLIAFSAGSWIAPALSWSGPSPNVPPPSTRSLSARCGCSDACRA